MNQKKRAHHQSTTFLKNQEVQHSWLLIDAKGKTLGRLACEVAKVLRGKHKATYTPHVDSGDGVIVVNAEQIVVTGNKEAQKMYHTHSGHIGSYKAIPYRTMKERKPERIIEHAVKGMMPKTKQGRHQMRRLRIFASGEHNMAAQKPIKVNV